MSYNGSGTFIINTTGQPVVDGTVISSTVFNALTADLANGLTTALTKDGQSTVTNNIPLNGYKITNLGAGTVATDAVQLGQIQSGGFSLVTVTGTDTYVGTMTPTLTAYTSGNFFTFVVPNTNTGPATLNINSLGAKVLSRDGSTALAAGDLVAGSEVAVVYDGTRFQVLNSNSKTNFTLSSGTANGVVYQNSSKALTSGSGFTYNSTGNLAVAAPSSGNTLALSNIAGNSALTTSDGTVASFLRTQASTSVDFGTTSAHALNLYTSFSNRLAINSTGNVTINAPTSGSAITAYAVSGSTGAFSAISTVSGSGSEYLQSWTNNTDSNLFVRLNQVGAATKFASIETTTATPLWLFTNNTQRVIVGSAGNVTINAPASGYSLTVSGTANATFTDGTGNYGIQMTAGAAYVGTTSNHSTTLRTNNTDRVVMSNTGNVTINAPSSGTALTIPATAQVSLFGSTSAANAYSAWQYNSTVLGYVGNGAGVAVGAGATDFGIGSTGARSLWLGSNDTARVAINSTGTVTINAATSGTTLNVAGTASGSRLVEFGGGMGVYESATRSNVADFDWSSTTFRIRPWTATGSTLELQTTPSGGSTTTRVSISSTGATTFSGSAATAPVVVTFSATAMTVNCVLSNVFTTTFTANVTTAPTISNPQDGQTINWFITQDATGSRTMTWPTSFKWPGGSAGVLSTAANAVDLLVATYRSSTGFWYATISKGFA